MIGRLFVLLLLILVNGYFAATEIALISLNENKIRKMAKEGHKKASDLMSLLDKPSKFLATIQIGITLAGFFASAFAAKSFSDDVVTFLMDASVPFSESILNSIVLVTITLILAYFTLVFGELVPKRIAILKHETIAFHSVGPLLIIMKVTKPFVKLLTMTTHLVLKVLGIDPNAENDEGSKEEIRLLVELGQEKGKINRHESDMIHNIFEFNNKIAQDMMTHRVEMGAVSEEISLEALIDVIKSQQHTRIPVYKDTIDHIVGFLHVKDLLDIFSATQRESIDVIQLIRPVIHIPKQMKAALIFGEMQQKKMHMAIVVDDYGGTAGLLTMEDLLEEIMGSIFDEFDLDDDLECVQISETVFQSKGLISLHDLEKVIGVNLPTDTYETLSGFLIALFGKIPHQGSKKVYKAIEFEILETTLTRIEAVKITKK